MGRLTAAIESARQEGDQRRPLLLEGILDDSEDHVDWLETQLEPIRQIGEELYLSTQVNGSESRRQRASRCLRGS